MMQRYNKNVDTFSFALVLLCLGAGDIDFVRKRGRDITSESYARGWRPTIPNSLRQGCPDLARLISEMWDGAFRKRPSLKVVVPRLEACSAFSEYEPAAIGVGATPPLLANSPKYEGGENPANIESEKDAMIEAQQGTILFLNAKFRLAEDKAVTLEAENEALKAALSESSA